MRKYLEVSGNYWMCSSFNNQKNVTIEEENRADTHEQNTIKIRYCMLKSLWSRRC